MRIPASSTQRGGDTGAMMTPMIDVVFQLIIFFLWTASFQRVEELLPSRVSSAVGSAAAEPDRAPPPEADFDDVIVQVSWLDNRPAWRLNGRSLNSLAEVRATLRAIARIRPTAPVILVPDGDVPLDHVIQLYDAARLEGFTRLQFAATESRSA
jgi:biopolymer transport protein ExbD